MNELNWRDFITRKILFLQPDELSPFIRSSLESNNEGSLAVFPLNGGRAVKNGLGELPLPFAELKIRRDQQDLSKRIISDPEWLLDTIATEKPEKINIVDDVVVDGITAREIRAFLQSRTGKSFAWILTTWLTCCPRKVKSASGVYGMESLSTSLVYRREDGLRVPTNSLSTWIYDQEKGDLVSSIYSNKYGRGGGALLDWIKDYRIRV